MRKIREILRLKYHAKLSHRQIGTSLSISPGTVSNVIADAKAYNYTWPLPDTLTDEDLEMTVYEKPSQAATHNLQADFSTKGVV